MILLYNKFILSAILFLILINKNLFAAQYCTIDTPLSFISEGNITGQQSVSQFNALPINSVLGTGKALPPAVWLNINCQPPSGVNRNIYKNFTSSMTGVSLTTDNVSINLPQNNDRANNVTTMVYILNDYIGIAFYISMRSFNDIFTVPVYINRSKEYIYSEPMIKVDVEKGLGFVLVKRKNIPLYGSNTLLKDELHPMITVNSSVEPDVSVSAPAVLRWSYQLTAETCNISLPPSFDLGDIDIGDLKRNLIAKKKFSFTSGCSGPPGGADIMFTGGSQDGYIDAVAGSAMLNNIRFEVTDKNNSPVLINKNISMNMLTDSGDVASTNTIGLYIRPTLKNTNTSIETGQASGKINIVITYK